MAARFGWLVTVGSLILGGCAMSFQWMIDSEGRQVQCSAGGTGLGAAVAIGAVEHCIATYRARGYVTLEEFEGRQAPPVEMLATKSSATVGAPELRVGDTWVYRLGGAAQGEFRRRVASIEQREGQRRYVIDEGRRLVVLDAELNPVELREGDSVTRTYSPALPHYFWPLAEGQRRDIRWSSEPRSGPTTRMHRIEVKAHGRIRVPAGEFEVYYLLVTRPDPLLPSIERGPRYLEIWYAPAIRYYVRLVVYGDDGRIVSELSSFTGGEGRPEPAAAAGG
jgi:hypothetical protein